MTRWEYDVLTPGDDYRTDKQGKTLNEYGYHGWEIIHVFQREIGRNGSGDAVYEYVALVKRSESQ